MEDRRSLPKSTRRLLIIIGLPILLVSSCKAIFIPTTEKRYRLEISVEIDGKNYTGGAVQQLTATGGARIFRGLSQTSAHYEFYGEAVAIDLDERGTLYALMRYPPPADKPTAFHLAKRYYSAFVPTVCGLRVGRFGYAVFIWRIRMLWNDCEVPIDEMPMLVRFANEPELDSVEQVDPKNLAATYGPSARFLGARISFTREPLSMEIEERLPWLEARKNKITVLNYDPKNPQLKEHLIRSEFTRH
ncbi:hypothetical protein HPQ64_15355 [Rhizobiales bacterium]|uniref:hypothetical protein n=1 Tax=Hongsoonwoonella zoysiae TaxID=2821844 RepID=UPI001560AAD0|nr:hypothetical protein [Hongsoonwoonella zoysiae]NRG19067.1 hypothetical protein [Hongsoonwoonella zoysiae]